MEKSLLVLLQSCIVEHIPNHTNTDIWCCLFRVTPDHRDLLAKMVPLAFEASLEKEVYPVLR